MQKEIEYAEDGLAVQHKSLLDHPEDLTPLTPEIISRQATINIGVQPKKHYFIQFLTLFVKN